MHNKLIHTVLVSGLLLTTALPAHAAAVFNRIASFPVAQNTPDAEETSSEIITVTDDGMMVIYSDSPAGGIGFVDISDPKARRQGRGFCHRRGGRGLRCQGQ